MQTLKACLQNISQDPECSQVEEAREDKFVKTMREEAEVPKLADVAPAKPLNWSFFFATPTEEKQCRNESARATSGHGIAVAASGKEIAEANDQIGKKEKKNKSEQASKDSKEQGPARKKGRSQ